MAQDTYVHDLVEFMQQVTEEMASEYDRIRRRTAEDPGTAGDQGEENWATLLRDWLPSHYEIVTKGRIIGEDGRTSPQVDVIVLKDIYPRKLLDKKLYLASGVAAAFECKTTLRAEHIQKAVKVGTEIKRLFPTQTGTLYRELHAPILYGLLAHSHDWKSPDSRPKENVTRTLLEADQSYVSHPRESLDLLCIADLGTWTLTKLALLPQGALSRAPQIPKELLGDSQYEKGIAWTSYFSYAIEAANQRKTFTPIGCLVANVSEKLAWENPSLRQLAQYYRKTDIMGLGGGGARYWPPIQIYSGEVYAQLPAGLSRFGNWSEWSYYFF